MRISLKILLVTILLSYGMYGQSVNKDIIGTWKGGLIKNGKIEDSYQQLRFISERKDGSLALTFIYELGPRSRVWSYDTDIKYDGESIEWFAHSGQLNQSKDTMWVLKDYKGEKSNWLF